MQKERCCKSYLKENKKGRHPELDSGSHLVAVLERGEIPYQVRNDNFIFNDNNKAFTLIELLVVVLIIGILAAVALPQYTLAVDKTRLMKLVAMTKSVVEAEEAYYLANNTYTQDWESLAVKLPGTIASNYTAKMSSSDGWTIILKQVSTEGWNGLTANDNRVADVILYVFYTHGSESVPHSPAGGGVSCYAKTSSAYAQKLCKSVTSKTTRNTHSGEGENSFNVYFFN